MLLCIGGIYIRSPQRLWSAAGKCLELNAGVGCFWQGIREECCALCFVGAFPRTYCNVWFAVSKSHTVHSCVPHVARTSNWQKPFWCLYGLCLALFAGTLFILAMRLRCCAREHMQLSYRVFPTVLTLCACCDARQQLCSSLKAAVC
jgi:hypothetical protein